MKKRMQTLVALVMAVLMVFSAISACAEEVFAFDYFTIDQTDLFNPEDPVMVELQKRTKTQITFTHGARDSYGSALQTLLAGGDLPEVIQVRDASQLAMLIDQGVIIPIEDLLAEYGQNILAAVGEDNYNTSKDADGHIYLIPFVGNTPINRGWMMRKDWLDRCGLEVPETLEQWIEVFKTFRDMDANGNGDATDEVALSGVVETLLYTFDIYNNDIFCVDPEGNYTLIYEHPNYRAWLETMAMLRAEGLLDPEYLDRNNDTNEGNLKMAISNDTIGCCYTYLNNMHMADDIEGAEYIYMAPPVGPYGTQCQPGRSIGVSYNAATISIAGEDKAVELIKLFDYIFSEEGQLLFNYGIEGYHYDMVDGKPDLRPEFSCDFPTYRQEGMNYQPIPHVWNREAYVEVFTKGASMEEMDSVARQFVIGTAKNEEVGVSFPAVMQTPAYVEYYLDLGAQAKALQASAIEGAISIDDFFTEYAKLKEEGLQEVIDEGNEAWQAIQ